MLIVDGSNLLGACGEDHRSVEAQRALVTRLAAVAREKRTRVLLFFDGSPSAAFGTKLGSLQVVFAGSRSADEAIVDAVRKSPSGQLTVVTSDGGLAARVAGRRVTLVQSHAFRATVMAAGTVEPASGGVDEWDAYFSDPKNRNV